MRSIAIALIATTVAGGAVLAQSSGPLPPLTEQVEVHVVNVDVSVTDSRGEPVSGLTQDDFELFEDGRPQKITNFSVVNGVTRPSSAPVAARSGARGNGRRILLIVDNNYLSVLDRNRALDAVRKYLDSSFEGEWAVASIGHSVDMLQPFTADTALVRAALARARNLPSTESQSRIDRAPLSERFNRRGDVTVIENDRAKFAFASREQTFRNLLTTQNTARAVIDTARAYAGEGEKNFMILLTGGMESNTTFSAYEPDNDRELQQLRLQIGQTIDAMVREANGANFTLYIINARPRGMPAPQADVTNRSSGNNTTGNLLRDIGNQPIDVSDVDSIPLSIALGTGGMYLPSSDIQQSLERIDDLTSNFYSLGYSPAHNGDRQYHAIEVRVKRRGVRVANRVGYFDEMPEDRFEDMLRLRTTFDSRFASLPVSVSVGPEEPAARDIIVPITAALPIARMTVVPQDANFVGRIHVYCSVFDEHGRNVGFSHQMQQVTIAPAQLSGTGEFRYTVKVHLQPGRPFTVVMTLRDELSNEVGSVAQALHP